MVYATNYEKTYDYSRKYCLWIDISSRVAEGVIILLFCYNKM